MVGSGSRILTSLPFLRPRNSFLPLAVQTIAETPVDLPGKKTKFSTGFHGYQERDEIQRAPEIEMGAPSR